MIKMIVISLILHPFNLIGGDCEINLNLKSIGAFKSFTESIARVETGTTHKKGKTVITNFRGCVGENQVHPQTAQFIIKKFDYPGIQISHLSFNRLIRDTLCRWMMTNYDLDFLEVANKYNLGANTVWINSNYVTQVMGNTNWLKRKRVTARKHNRNGSYLIKIKGDI